MNSIRRISATTIALAAWFAIGAARADDATSLRRESSRFEHNTAVTGESRVSSRISQDFAGFAGSDDNASSLVAGLRRGTSITLTTPSGADPQSNTISFTPPTRPMGNGNVYISLALAKQQLAGIGITQPTADEIKAALVGGTVTTGSGATAKTVTLPGVLTQRSDGMGWGAIARSQGVKLGTVVSGMKSANHHLSAIHPHQQISAATGVRSAGSVNAARVSANAGTQRGHGIVTAAGGPGVIQGKHSAGVIVSGTGGVRSSSASATAAAMGQARGHTR